jgi:hypothetical protein
MNKPESSARYGRRHRDLRARALASFRDGQACVRCYKPMHSSEDIDLDHDDDDPTKYRGLAHATCNRAAGGAIGGATTAERYFGKGPGSKTLNVPRRPAIACTSCTNPRCWRGVGWNSVCW